MANTSKFNAYQAVTDRIISQLENGIIPWHQPWRGIKSGAFNRITGKPYSLINQMILKQQGEYATFKQWNSLGAKIKKGAKSEMVVFWKIIKVEEEKNGQTIEKKIPLLRYYNVFHISQVEGVEPLAGEANELEPIEQAEQIISNYAEREGIEIRNEAASNEAYYSISHDYIQVPCMEQYENVNEYYSTLLHECSHSTGAKGRLDRFDANSYTAKFGDEDYSLEELVAEISTSFIMNEIGIETTSTFNNSAAYIGGWLSKLKGDNKLIVKAASKAEKAAKYICNIE